MRTLPGLVGLVLLMSAAAAVQATPTPAPALSPILQSHDDGVEGRVVDEARLGRKCTRKVRRHYGSARGRHVKSLRLAFVQRCIQAGGRLN